jgi:hypothetical protein
MHTTFPHISRIFNGIKNFVVIVRYPTIFLPIQNFKFLFVAGCSELLKGSGQYSYHKRLDGRESLVIEVMSHNPLT